MSGRTVERPVIAESFPASTDSIKRVLGMEIGDDGRSNFVWLRLANGDLILGVWPRGEGYESMEAAVESDYTRAVDNGAESILWAEGLGTVEVGPGVLPRAESVRYED